jgi:hypothetical protein
MSPEDTIRRFCDAINDQDADGTGGTYEVAARRVQHWTETNELASEEELSVLIELDEQGPVTRAQMNPKGA